MVNHYNINRMNDQFLEPRRLSRMLMNPWRLPREAAANNSVSYLFIIVIPLSRTNTFSLFFY